MPASKKGVSLVALMQHSRTMHVQSHCWLHPAPLLSRLSSVLLLAVPVADKVHRPTLKNSQQCTFMRMMNWLVWLRKLMFSRTVPTSWIPLWMKAGLQIRTKNIIALFGSTAQFMLNQFSLPIVHLNRPGNPLQENQRKLVTQINSKRNCCVCPLVMMVRQHFSDLVTDITYTTISCMTATKSYPRTFSVVHMSNDHDSWCMVLEHIWTL